MTQFTHKSRHRRTITHTPSKSSKDAWRVKRFSGLNPVASKSVNVPTEQPCSAVIPLKQARRISR